MNKNLVKLNHIILKMNDNISDLKNIININFRVNIKYYYFY